jgi:DNA-damage-inducible protein J
LSSGCFLKSGGLLQGKGEHPLHHGYFLCGQDLQPRHIDPVFPAAGKTLGGDYRKRRRGGSLAQSKVLTSCVQCITVALHGGNRIMSRATINIRTDSEIKAKAQKIFESLGLDMTTAINIFLRQTVRHNDLPFVLGSQPKGGDNCALRRPLQYDSLKGKAWMSGDFDAPLEDFKEYR